MRSFSLSLSLSFWVIVFLVQIKIAKTDTCPNDCATKSMNCRNSCAREDAACHAFCAETNATCYQTCDLDALHRECDYIETCCNLYQFASTPEQCGEQKATCYAACAWPECEKRAQWEHASCLLQAQDQDERLECSQIWFNSTVACLYSSSSSRPKNGEVSSSFVVLGMGLPCLLLCRRSRRRSSSSFSSNLLPLSTPFAPSYGAVECQAKS